MNHLLGFGVLAALGAFAFIIGIGLYLVQAFAFYFGFKKAGVPYPWLAFIPIARLWMYMRVIKKSAWNILWVLVPIADIVFAILWQARYYKAFGMSRLWLLLYLGLLVPGLNYAVATAFLVIYCIIGFSSSYRYDPDFDNPSGPSGFAA